MMGGSGVRSTLEMATGLELSSQSFQVIGDAEVLWYARLIRRQETTHRRIMVMSRARTSSEACEEVRGTCASETCEMDRLTPRPACWTLDAGR